MTKQVAETKRAVIRFGEAAHDDDGTQITVFRNGMPVVTGVAPHSGCRDETLSRAVRNACAAYRQIRRACGVRRTT